MIFQKGQRVRFIHSDGEISHDIGTIKAAKNNFLYVVKWDDAMIGCYHMASLRLEVTLVEPEFSLDEIHLAQEINQTD